MIQIRTYFRSGTHLMAASIHKNFKFNNDLSGKARTVSPYQNHKWYATGEIVARVPWQKLLGAPHTPFNRISNSSYDKIVFVIRNPKDTLYSLYKFSHTNKTFSEWCTNERIKEWKNHVNPFINNKDKIFIVKYENIVSNFENVMKRIEKKFKLKRKLEKFEPVTEIVGWRSNRSDEKLDEFPEEVRQRMIKILDKEYYGYKI